MHLRELWETLVETAKEFIDDGALRLGAALAYYSVFSIAPLLLIATSVAGAVFGEEAVRGELEAHLTGSLGKGGATAVQDLVANTGRHEGGFLMSVIGLGMLLVGAGGVFGQLQDALNTVWGVKSPSGRPIWRILKERFLSFSMVLGMGFLLLISMTLTTALQLIRGSVEAAILLPNPLWILVGDAMSFGAIVALFAAIFKVLPDAQVAWKDVWSGALFTAILFAVGKVGLGWYLGREATTASYGAAGSLAIVLLWVHYSSLILLFGAEFTQVRAARRGCAIIPARGAEISGGKA
jgi:membrane protein